MDDPNICPECERASGVLKHYFYDDDAEETVGYLMQCEECGALYNIWYPKQDESEA